MSEIDFKEKLQQLRRETEETLTGAESYTQPVELDQTSVGRVSRIDAIQQQEMALNNVRRLEQKLIQIDNALKRIESGDFGYCIKCGEDIAPKRLALDPTIMICVECASEK